MSALQSATGYQLSFPLLLDGREAFVFPCDAHGHVDMDSLSERVRHDYLYARALMGIDVARPTVRSHSG